MKTKFVLSSIALFFASVFASADTFFFLASPDGAVVNDMGLWKQLSVNKSGDNFNFYIFPEGTEGRIESDVPDGGKWVYPVSEGVVSLQTTRDTGYQSYIMVQNELTRAFNEVRDEVAQRKFGAKFADLPEELRNAVSKAVPLKISEAEPRNIKK